MGAGNAARAIAWCAAITVTARHAVGDWQLARTLAWLRHAGDEPTAGQQLPPVHVIVPVLREQEHVSAALEWWRQILPQFPGISLTIVSTAREESERDLLAAAACSAGRLTRTGFPQLSDSELAALTSARVSAGGQLGQGTAAKILARTPLTREVVGQLLAREDPSRIRHLTYPGTGRKAAQVNYAARSLPASGYLAVYDVDSRPGAELLARTYALLSRPGEEPAVVQQHALHAATRAGQPLARRVLVCGSAALQSMWTLRREIPYARRYQQSAGRPGIVARLRAGLPQPVGHGVFLRQDVLVQLGGLPEMTVLDDVPAGVPIALRGIPVLSVAAVTTVPAPGTVGEVIAQHRRWFCSYLDYPAVLCAAARASPGHAGHRYLLSGIAAYRGAAWLAAGPLTAVTLAAAAWPRSGRKLRVTACAGLILATVVPAVIVTSARQGPVPAGQAARHSGELLAAYLLRSAGPWLAVWDAVRGRHPASAAAPSPKTHRREGAEP